MSRYHGDQNKVVLVHESGTYASSSGTGQWIGQITSSAITDSEGKFTYRFLGTGDRTRDGIFQGPRDVSYNLSYRAQDFRLPFWAIGSVKDTSGTNAVHTAAEVQSDVRQSAYTSGTLNPPISFSIEDSKTSPGTGQNFIRTINGCVPDSVTITAAQGEVVTVDINGIGQTLTWSSGTATSVTAYSNRPYFWSDCSLVLSGGSVLTAKSIRLQNQRNVEGPHYLNGSRDISVPFENNRDYILTVEMDLSNEDAKNLYSSLFKSNGAFNATFDLNADSTTGSQHARFILSGCYIMSYDVPSESEGVNSSTLEINADNLSATEWTSQAGNALFNPW